MPPGPVIKPKSIAPPPPPAPCLRPPQIATVLGRGRHRPQARKDVLKPRQGLDGEDVVDDGLALGLGLAAATSTTLKLRMPLRFSAGSVKGAAWQVRAR